MPEHPLDLTSPSPLGGGGRNATNDINSSQNFKFNQQQESTSTLMAFFRSIKGFLALITIEPLLFFAIMALYIEFPSIQDLIYTKICLQVVSKNPNFTTTLNQYNTTTNPLNNNELSLKPELRVSEINFSSNVNNILKNIEQNRTNSGRIQQLNGANNINSIESLSITLPTNPRDQFICDRLNKTAVPAEIRQEIADGDSLFWLKYQLIVCVLCVISSPYWGGMSDKIGRLIPLNVPIVIAVLSNGLSLAFGLLISLKSHNLFSVELLYIGAVLTGLSGGQAIVIVNSFSFISDNTSSESRSKRVALLESVIFVAHSVGFYVSKHIMKLGLETPERPWFNRHFVAFSSCVILNLIAVLYAIFKLRHRKFHRFSNNFEREQQEAFAGDVLSNSITSGNFLGGRARDLNQDNCMINAPHHQIGSVGNVDRLRELTASTPDDLDGPIAQSDKVWADWGVVLTFKYYKQTYETLTKRRESRTIILLLLLCGFISAMSLACLMSLLFIYLHTDPFNWSTSQYSQWNSITSLTRGVALICLTLTKLLKVLTIPDPIVAAIGFLSKGVGLLMIALAQSSDIINWSILAFLLSEYSMPPIRSLLSKLVVKEEVGKVYSCLAAIQSICFLIGNIIFYLAYTSLGLQAFFRLSFLLVASFQFAAVIIMLIIFMTLRHRVMII